MMRDCRRERWPHRTPIESPVLQNGPAARDGLLLRGEEDAIGLFPNRWRHCFEQARYRLIERAIGHHRGDHGSHPDIIISSRDRLDSLERWSRKFAEEVVSCRAALTHELGRAEECRDIVY